MSGQFPSKIRNYWHVSAASQRLTQVALHFPRNALDHIPRKAVDDCLQELRSLSDRSDLAEVQKDLTQWLDRWGRKYPKWCEWVEESVAEILNFYRLPLPHDKHMKSTNMLERFNEEIRRRTRVVRISPHGESCLRLIRALAVETHESCLEASRYLNMDLLKGHKKLRLRKAAYRGRLRRVTDGAILGGPPRLG